MRRLALLLVFSLLFAPLLGLDGSGASAPPVGASAPLPDHAVETDSRGAAPLMFIENVGQFADTARFQARIGGGTLWLAEDAVWLSMAARSLDEASSQGVKVCLSFAESNRRARMEPFGRLDTCVSYFRGDDPSHWYANVPVWGGVRYLDLYPGVDLEISGVGGRWSWGLVGSNGSPLAVNAVPLGEREVALGTGGFRLRADGAESLSPDGNGGLRLTTAVGEYTIPSPFSAGSATIMDNASELLYGTYVGGGSSEDKPDIAVDGSGAVYVTGWTYSYDFPTTEGAYKETHGNGGWDAFVAKLNPSGTELVYSTYLGGGDEDSIDGGQAIAVDQSGKAYVSGITWSTDFPTTSGSYDRTHNGGIDVFVVKLSATGSTLEYSTLLGGSQQDYSSDIALDAAGRAYVVGETLSSDFPATSGAFDESYGGSEKNDGFAAKFDALGSDLVYCSYLGGSGADRAQSVAVDSSGAAYVTGHTYSDDFPTTNGAQDTDLSGPPDGFVVKLSANGGSEVYGTYLGGLSSDRADSIALDASGAAYVTGISSSYDFPTTPGAYDTTIDGADAYVAKLNPSGSAFAYCTLVGGADADLGMSIAVDGDGSAHIVGETLSSDFPTTAGAFDTSFAAGVCGTPPVTYTCKDAFLAKLSPGGGFLEYGTYLGTDSAEQVPRVALDSSGSAYVTGRTKGTDFPTTAGAYDRTHNGNYDAFVVKLALAALEPTPTATTPAVCPDQYEPNEDFAGAIEIAPGSEIQSYICDESDVDWFKFDVTSGQEIQVDLTNLPDDYDLELYDPGEVMIRDSAAGGLAPERILWIADSTGAWGVKVFGYLGFFDPANPYTLGVQVGVGCPDQYEPNDDFGSAIKITPFGEVYSYICSPTDEDWFKFEVSAGQLITVYLTDLTADFDLELHDPGGSLMDQSMEFGCDPEEVSGTAAVSGDYRAYVCGFSDACDFVNPYTIMVQLGGGPIPSPTATGTPTPTATPTVAPTSTPTVPVAPTHGVYLPLVLKRS